MTGERSKVLEIGALVPQLSEVFFAHNIVGEGFVLCHAKPNAASTSSSSVVVGGPLFLLGGGSSLHCHGRGHGGIVLFAGLPPVGVGNLQEHGGKESAGDGHINVCLLLVEIVVVIFVGGC